MSSKDANKNLLNFYKFNSPDILEKCTVFSNTFDNVNIISDHFNRTIESSLNPVTRIDGKDFLFFDSNGYLGFQTDKKIIEAISKAMLTHGAGTPSVPLLGGKNDIAKKLEKTLAKFYGREDAILFSSGYDANLGTLQALLRPNDYVVYDECAHASIYDGIKLSRHKKAIRYKFNDLADLEKKLSEIRKNDSEGGIIVATDGVFSMQGAILDLIPFQKICKKYNAKSFVDECHSLGVLGNTGKGIEEHSNSIGACDIISGCFSKAIGLKGGYVVGSKELIAYLRFFANPAIFSTSMPAAFCAGILKGMELLVEEPQHHKKLVENINYVRKLLEEKNIKTNNVYSAIFSFVIGENELLFPVADYLIKNGLRFGVVGYPAVKTNQGILRASITALHSKEQLLQAVTLLEECFKKFKIN